MSAVRSSKFLLKTGCGDIENTIFSSVSQDIGVSIYTFWKRLSPEKKSLCEYISEESSHKTDSSGNIEESSTSELPSPSDTTEDIISTDCTSSLESWVLQSKVYIPSISSPQKERR